MILNIGLKTYTPPLLETLCYLLGNHGQVRFTLLQ